MRLVAPCQSSQSLKIGPEFLRSKLARVSLVFAFLLAACVHPSLGQNVPKASTPTSLARAQWIPQPGVRRYRIQIAVDERFNDMMFDGVVSGSEYIPRDLAPGHYHWRVASADSPGKGFLKVGQLEVTAASAANSVIPGWVATTGEVSAPMTAQLRAGRDLDFLATNSSGTVYALDSALGMALWTARYNMFAEPAGPGVRQFVPLVLQTANTTLVIVAFEKGLRALEGRSGKEVWRVEGPEGIVGGLAANLDDNPGPEIYLTEDTNDKLLCLDGQTGRMETEIKLSGRPVGPPVLLDTKTVRRLLVPLQGNIIDVRGVDGSHVQSVRLSADLTTAPVTVQASSGVLMIVGTKEGLIAFETNAFQPVARISIADGHYPAGSLAIVDIDGDKSSDRVVFITNLGRIVAVNPSDNRISWSADGFSPTASVAFGDLNADGLLDVVAPDNQNFAVGLSGNSGMRIWESPEAGSNIVPTRSPTPVKKLAAATLKDGRIIVVGNDTSAPGLRAVELRKGTAAPANE